MLARMGRSESLRYFGSRQGITQGTDDATFVLVRIKMGGGNGSLLLLQ